MTTISEADAAYTAACEELLRAKALVLEADRARWRAHEAAWLARARSAQPLSAGMAEVITTRNVPGIGEVVWRRARETVIGWSYTPWASDPVLHWDVLESAWVSDPATAYAMMRPASRQGGTPSPYARHRDAWADWCAFCARHGQPARTPWEAR